MEELNSILEKMIANGESQDAINIVIAEWEKRNPGVLTPEAVGLSKDSVNNSLYHEDQDKDNSNDGFFGFLPQAFAQGDEAVGGLDVLLEGNYDQDSIKELLSASKAMENAPMAKAAKEYEEQVDKRIRFGANPITAYFQELLSNKVGALQMFASSITAAGSAAVQKPGYTASAVAGGALSGSRLGPTPQTRAMGAVAGGLRGLQAGSMFVLEAGGTMVEEAKKGFDEKGWDWYNMEDWKKYQEDEDLQRKVQLKGLGRGATISLAEYYGAKLTGKGAAKAADLFTNRIAKGAARATTAVGGEMVTAGVGEATALGLVQGQDITSTEGLKQIGQEIVIGSVGAPISVVQSFAEESKNNYVVNSGKTKDRKKVNSIIYRAEDKDFINMRLTSDDKVFNDKVRKRRENIIRNNKSIINEKVQPQKVTDVLKKLNLALQIAKEEKKQAVKDGGEIAGKVFDKKIEELQNKKLDLENLISFQVDQLSEEEALNLMDMDDDVSLYQSIINDANSTESAKKSAREQLEKIKADQMDLFNNSDANDLARQEGPVKQKNIDLSEKTQKAYEAKGKDSWGEVSKYQEGLVNSIANSMWSKVPADKKIGTIDDFKAALKSDKEGIYGLVQTYKPETGVPLSAYIANPRKGLRKRANRIIKKFTKQDIQKSLDTDQVKSAYSDGINLDNIDLGPRFTYQKLGLGELLGDLNKDTELGLQKVKNKLDLLGKVTDKKRQKESLKSFNELFSNKYKNKIKDFIGKNTKKQKSFSKYLRNNLPVLKRIALKNVDFQMGSSLISQTWNKIPPSDQDFLDYYEGADSPTPQTLSDRKTRLVKAITDQLATDARESYFENNPEERNIFNEEQNLSFEQDEVTSATLQNVINDIDTILANPETWSVGENEVQEIYDELQAIDELEANFNITPDSRARREELQKQLDEKLKPVDDEAINRAVDKVIQEEVVSKIDHDNTEKITVTDNKEKVIDELESNIEKGYIAPNHLKKIGNFGAETAYKGRDGKFYSKEADAYKGAPKFYVMKEPVDGSEGIYLPYDKSHLNNDLYKGKFKATRGGLYYGQKDPLLIKHLKSAEKNYKGKIINEQPNLNLFTKTTNIIVNKMISLPALKKLVDNHKSKVKTNQDIVIQMTEDFSNAIKDGANPWVMSLMIKSAYKGTTGLIKGSYEFKGYETGKLELKKV